MLRQECHKYIKREKRATVGASPSPSHLITAYPPVMLTAHFADMMYEFVRSTRLSKVELSVEEVLQIVNTLVYDGKVDAHESSAVNGTPWPGGTVFYTPAAMPLQEHSDLTGVPCGVCPVAADCHEGGMISPETCEYYDAWMRLDDAGGAGAGAGAAGEAGRPAENGHATMIID